MEGKLIIEVYEYAEDSEAIPEFEYIRCDLSKCMKGRRSTLKEIIERGFDDVPRRTQDKEKKQEILQKIEEADIGRISVVCTPGGADSDACVELTNVVPVNLMYADARRAKGNKDEIILKGRYRLSEGNEVTRLRDAQRLTLIYSSYEDGDPGNGGPEDGEREEQKEICLNITYLQE